MSILASLNDAYGRMAVRHEVPAFGFSNQKIGFIIALNSDGTLASPPIDWRDVSSKKPVPRMMTVPQPVKRTAGIAPNFLWDKTAYVLGITAGDRNRLMEEHGAFVEYHLKALDGTQDEGLQALLRFLQAWNPDQYEQQDWPDDIKANLIDQNIVFVLESDRNRNIYLHDRPAAKQLWNRLNTEGDKTEAVCLVTGERAPIARLHPSIKGVWGGQSSGTAIVSFNLDAFSSYGHEQGNNAPVSEAAAAGYTTVLNKFLEKDSPNRIQIGDASTVFWADASGVVGYTQSDVAEEAEALFVAWFDDQRNDKIVDEAAEEKNVIRPLLEKIRQGESLRTLRPDLTEGVRFYVLGLAPNASRLSVRFWLEDDFGKLADNYQKFLNDMHIEPPDRQDNIALWQYLREVAVLGKTDNVPPNLAGEWMRAILTGTNYPMTLLANILLRIRADKTINARRVSILKAVLIRNLKSQEAPLALDTDNRNKGYLLGRLFALYEQVQSAALGRNVNATIKDKFYGSASAQPGKVFHLLERGSANHLSKLGKKMAGYKVNLEKQINDIMSLMSPTDNPFPAVLSCEQQALFGLGYYHQRSEFFKPKPATSTEGTTP